MNTITLSPSDSTTVLRALEATHARLRSHVRWRTALYAGFALMSLLALLFVAIRLGADVGAVPTVWPAALIQVGGMLVLSFLLRQHRARMQSLRARALPMLAALERQKEDLLRRRRQSVTLLILAALSVPLLLLSVAMLADHNTLPGNQGIFLGLACVLPGLVIGGVHGSRLAAQNREREWLSTTLRELEDS